MAVRITPLNISFQERDRSMDSVVESIRRHLRANPGNNLVYCPSLAYLDQHHQKLTAFDIASFAQRAGMAESERDAFLAKFTKGTDSVGLAVMGGIFAEGIDLPGDQLVGVTVIGVGLLGLSIERDLLATYFDQKNDPASITPIGIPECKGPFKRWYVSSDPRRIKDRPFWSIAAFWNPATRFYFLVGGESLRPSAGGLGLLALGAYEFVDFSHTRVDWVYYIRSLFSEHTAGRNGRVFGARRMEGIGKGLGE